ncbi:MAG: hypothetical protein ACE5HS_18095 [bacterium]
MQSTQDLKIENPQRPFLKIAWICLAIFSLAAVVGFVTNLTGAMAMAIAVPVLVGLLFMIFVFYLTGKKQIKRIQQMLAGGCLAHWSCSPEEWNRFAENQSGRNRRTVVIFPFGMAIFLLLVSLSVHFLTETHLVWWHFFFLTFLGWATGFLIILPVYLRDKFRYRKRSKGPVEIFIGQHGVYQGGQFYEIKEKLSDLEDVTLIPGDPEILELNVAYATIPRGGDVIRIPVPEGCRQEALELVRKMQPK